MDDLITVKTDLFNHRVVKPHFVNPCCFGEDFAAWLREQLSPLAGSGFNLSEIIQEDYGWGLLGPARKRSILVGPCLRRRRPSRRTCAMEHLCQLRSRAESDKAAIPQT